MLSKDEGGGEEPFTDELQLMMYSKTWNVTTSIKIASEGKEMVMPGMSACWGRTCLLRVLRRCVFRCRLSIRMNDATGADSSIGK